MLWAIFTASSLLLLGVALRSRVRLLQLCCVPASVAGGLVGLVGLQITLALPDAPAVASDLAEELRGWPGPLLAVVFAGLLLERPQRRLGESMRGAALAAMTVWIIVLGEIVIGLLATWLVIGRRYEVPDAFGQLIEAGFAGGHGTANALGLVFKDVLEFPAGLDLGLFVATVGLVYSVVSGIVFVNIGVRCGWTRGDRSRILSTRPADAPVADRRMGTALIRGDVLDPLALQLIWVVLAVLIGAGLQWCFATAAARLTIGDVGEYLTRVPLFLFTLIGGLVLRHLLRLLRLDHLLDGESIRHIVAIAMEFLIVAAIASLRLEALAQYLWPITLLLVLGFGWTGFCLLYVSRRTLPADHWFELGILNYGMSTGTTAQGMMLLRIVDPDLESQAAEQYALAAPLSAPFIGGGVITLTLPLVLLKVGIAPVIAVLAVAIVTLYAGARAINRRPTP